MNGAARVATPFERVLQRDRALVIAALVCVLALAWAYVVAGAGMDKGAGEISSMSAPAGESVVMQAQATAPASPMPMPMQMQMQMAAPAPSWTAGHAALMFAMWWVMMVAMMLPSAAPMILLYAAVNRRQRARGAPFVPTGAFATGYLAAWAGFSVAAVALQWGLDRTGMLSSMMASNSALFGAALLVLAGAWQLTPAKRACLEHCRSPVEFLSAHWRPGPMGGLRMGIEHGAWCLGCCWFLMGLLFFGGVMNLYWIVGLTAYVLVEKVLPAGHRLGSLTGVVLLCWGVLEIGRALA